MDDSGFESRWERDFPYQSRPPPNPTQAPVRGAPGLFPWGKPAGAWFKPTLPSSAEAKGRLELFLYTPSGPSWPIIDGLHLLPLIFGYNLVFFINKDSGKSHGGIYSEQK